MTKTNPTWILRLPEAGTVRDLVSSLSRHDADIDDAIERLRGLRRERARMIKAAEKRIAKDWSADEITYAKRAAHEPA